MERADKSFYRSILGDTKDTINAIQKFIEKSSKKAEYTGEEAPADSVNRIIKSIQDEDTIDDIQKIIKNL